MHTERRYSLAAAGAAEAAIINAARAWRAKIIVIAAPQVPGTGYDLRDLMTDPCPFVV
jgi:hypothetical protein